MGRVACLPRVPPSHQPLPRRKRTSPPLPPSPLQALGDYLLVGLYDDDTVAALHGDPCPLQVLGAREAEARDRCSLACLGRGPCWRNAAPCPLPLPLGRCSARGLLEEGPSTPHGL